MTRHGSDVESDEHIDLDALLDQFSAAFRREADIAVRAPGRVNLIGDHTDYNDGFVLPATIDRDVYVLLAVRNDPIVRLRSANFDESLEYPVERPPDVPAASWKSYVTGAIEELRTLNLVSHGFDMLVTGNVPLGAGLSSSAALEVAVVFGLQSLLEFELNAIDCIRLCQRVEHRYAGVQCGIMDQFCSRLGRRDHALFLDCRSLEYEHEPLPLADAGLAIVIVNSRVSRELAGSKYGERRRECEAAVDVLRRSAPDIVALRDVSADLLHAERGNLDAVLASRARHVVEENERVLQAAAAMRAGDYGQFGQLMNASHDSLRDLYEVSIPELDLLVSEAQSTVGVLGARMTGGGFGGCTVNLVEADSVEELRGRLEWIYEERFRRRLDVYVLEENHQTEILFRAR